MKHAILLGVAFTLVSSLARAADMDPTRVLPPGKLPADARLGPPKTLDDYFPFAPPASKEAWKARRRALREQILVATGLWPLPDRKIGNVVIHSPIDRDGYTVEKVFFASYPGHYVSGNLYRPKEPSGKRPGVLCPHGHWPQGRFFDDLAAHGEAHVRQQIEKGAEKTVEGARFPLQARCAQLARMGCVVFHYDMVGNADSTQIPHRSGFTDPQALLRSQSFMGLQTFNSLCALDFLCQLPDVDPSRIGVTGASGGGTQTFMLCAIDDRPAAAFPAVMVSTAMQGGCICENCPYLRQGTGNVEIAGLFAPRPLGMTGANDWTLEIETKGLPELKALYRLYDVEDRVMAHAFPQFEHNYNQVSREVMYNWFNKHLRLGQPEPVVEKRFTPVPPRELSVYDAEHPRPKDAVGAEGLRNYLTESSDRQLATLRPHNGESLQRFQQVLGTALRVLMGGALPQPNLVESRALGDSQEVDGVHWQKLLLGRKGEKVEVPAVWVHGAASSETVVIWVDPAGKQSLLEAGKLTPAARAILAKAAILAPDVLWTGESAQAKRAEVNRQYAGYTFGYNRPLLAERVQDILLAVAVARLQPGIKNVELVGWQEAGPWVLLARGLCGSAVARAAADGNQFAFDSIQRVDDPMFLPGALKYGGISALAAVGAPAELFLYNQRHGASDGWLKATYQAAGAEERLQQQVDRVSSEKVVDWLLR
jgi:dienelactone hydrolase